MFSKLGYCAFQSQKQSVWEERAGKRSGDVQQREGCNSWRIWAAQDCAEGRILYNKELEPPNNTGDPIWFVHSTHRNFKSCGKKHTYCKCVMSFFFFLTRKTTFLFMNFTAWREKLEYITLGFKLTVILEGVSLPISDHLCYFYI